MPLGLTTPVLAAVLGVVFFGGLVKGTAGFGYAIASTAILASFRPPREAVVVMILPMLVANLALLRELGLADLRSCAARFWPYVAAAVVGTLGGMALLGRIPKPALALGLGGLTLLYVAVTQEAVALPGESFVAERCFRPGTAAKVALGLASGAVFGASNIAVQVVAYLDSLSLDRSTFVGVLAMILVGVSGVRVGAAWALGLYGGSGVAVSALAVVPGLAGVAAGRRLRAVVSERTQTVAALGLLTVIGVRLVGAGLGLF